MFKDIFSFKGRIRRKEFGLTLIAIFFVNIIASILIDLGETDTALLAIGWVIMLATALLQLAQGAKRCHDLNRPGWFQLIPFYIFWMAFEQGPRFSNRYGPDPKQTGEMIRD